MDKALLRFQSKLDIYIYIYRSNIYSDLVICSRVSCSHHVAVCLGLILSFLQNITLFSCNFPRTNRKQVINNKIGETMRGEVIVVFGCVEMAYLDVPLHNPRTGNIRIRSTSMHSRTKTILNRCVTLIIHSVTMLFYECLKVYRN